MFSDSELRTRCGRLFTFSLTIALIANGCGKTNKPNTPSGGGVSAVSPVATTDRPSDGEVKALVAKLESHIAQRDLDAFNSEIDWNAVVDRALDGLPLSAKAAQGFRRGVLESAGNQDKSIGAQIFKQIETTGSFRFLRVRDHEGASELVFRVIPDAGVTYFGFRLDKVPGGETHIVDVYMFISGQYLSSSLRHSAYALVQQESRGAWDKLTRQDVEYVKQLPTIGKLMEAARGGRTEEAWTYLESLPEGFRYDRNTAAIAVSVGQQIEETKYSAYLDQLRVRYPNDPTLDLMLLDSYLLKEQWGEYEACLNRFDRNIGGDPFLDSVRAAGLDLQGKHAEAKQAYARAIENLPDEEHIYWIAIVSSLEHKEFADVAARLSQLSTRFSMKFDNLETEPLYAEFIKSPEYAEWKKTQVAAEKSATVDEEKE
jgi:hypothetical protein